jgi:hypothetical protein
MVIKSISLRHSTGKPFELCLEMVTESDAQGCNDFNASATKNWGIAIYSESY